MNFVRRLFSFEFKDINIFNGNSILYFRQESLRLKLSVGGCQWVAPIIIWRPLAEKSNLTSLINKRSYSSHSDASHKIVLSPNFVTGFTDAEGCFYIKISKSKTHSLGWKAEAKFSITLHEKDFNILEGIQAYFGVGKIHFGKGSVSYRVESSKHLRDTILPHFDKYPLITQKLADYLLFKEVVRMIINKEQLIQEGLVKIVAIKSSMNLGLSEALKTEFSTEIYDPYPRPLVENKKVKDPQWVAGFTSGEGCFKVFVQEHLKNLAGFRVMLGFTITQHNRDENLMKSFIDYFGCGKIEHRGDRLDFMVKNLRDTRDIIMPFFQKYPIVGVKSKDFDDWCLVVKLIIDKEHITNSGVEKIRKIKANMNRQRSQNEEE